MAARNSIRAVEEAGFAKEMVSSEAKVGWTAILEEDRVGRVEGGLGLVGELSLGRGGWRFEETGAGACWLLSVIGDIGTDERGEESTCEDTESVRVFVDCWIRGGFVVRGLRSELVRLGGLNAVSWRVAGVVFGFRVSWLWYLRRGKSCTVGPGASSESS